MIVSFAFHYSLKPLHFDNDVAVAENHVAN